MKHLLGALFLMIPFLSAAGPTPELWPRWESHQPTSEASIDHSRWSALLDRYLNTDSQPHRFDYAGVSAADRKQLDQYLAALQATPISEHNRGEQLAYWINLYNAATIQLVLDHYPVKSITKIKSGFFSFGPWDKKFLKVEGQELSLNDIEHRILRPIFKDPRIHYAVNCASIGCPSLAAEAFTASQMEAMLSAAAALFINDPRGVRFEGDELVVSSIFEWFVVDFGGDETGVIAHLRQHADAALRQRLQGQAEIDDYQYDWSLNASQ